MFCFPIPDTVQVLNIFIIIQQCTKCNHRITGNFKRLIGGNKFSKSELYVLALYTLILRLLIAQSKTVVTPVRYQLITAVLHQAIDIWFQLIM